MASEYSRNDKNFAIDNALNTVEEKEPHRQRHPQQLVELRQNTIVEKLPKQNRSSSPQQSQLLESQREQKQTTEQEIKKEQRRDKQDSQENQESHLRKQQTLLQKQEQFFAKLRTMKGTKLSLPVALIISALGCVLLYRFYQEIFVIDPVVGVYGLLSVFIIFFSFLVSHTKYKDPSLLLCPSNGSVKNSAINNRFEHAVSIIIAAKNEPVIIRNTVYSCLLSTYRNLEVILVNDGSTDETGNVMDSLHKENPDRVTVIQLAQNMGKRKAIREGLKHSKLESDIIMMLDSDTVIENTAVEKLVRIFDDPDVGGATSYVRPVNADKNLLTKMQDTWYHGSFGISKAMESSFGTVTCCSGVLSAYRKEAVMICVDAWCEDKFLGVEFKPGDDRHLTSYLIGGSKHYLGPQNKVWKTVYCESAHTLTEVPSTFRKFVNQQVRWKKSWIRVFLFTAPYYYKDRPALAAAFYYIQMAFSLISPLVAARNLILLPVLGHYSSAIVYVAGILFIAFCYALQFKFQNPNSGCRWLYRTLLAFLSLGFLSMLLYYALITIRRNSWLTR
jgi:cellulose synthase/poly-beta-1,6-N-acetylglucosamine synthase-like glycosyltransferase